MITDKRCCGLESTQVPGVFSLNSAVYSPNRATCNAVVVWETSFTDLGHFPPNSG